MTDEARAAMNAYRREYRRKNPEKVRAQQRLYMERYWTKKAQQAKEAAERKEEGDNATHKADD